MSKIRHAMNFKIGTGFINIFMKIDQSISSKDILNFIIRNKLIEIPFKMLKLLSLHYYSIIH
jgi:hypothetical protein